MIPQLRTFHGDKKIKAEYIARVKDHVQAGEIIQGHYRLGDYRDAINATVHSSSHMDYETKLGIPFVVARIEDRVFEALPSPDFKEFPVKFLEIIPVGISLKMASYKFFSWLLYGSKYSLYSIESNISVQKDIKLLSDYLLIRMERQTTSEERSLLTFAETNLKALRKSNYAASAAYNIVKYFKLPEQAWLCDVAIKHAQLAYTTDDETKKLDHGNAMAEQLLKCISDNN
jgi:hypothetical protein